MPRGKINALHWWNKKGRTMIKTVWWLPKSYHIFSTFVRIRTIYQHSHMFYNAPHTCPCLCGILQYNIPCGELRSAGWWTRDADDEKKLYSFFYQNQVFILRANISNIHIVLFRIGIQLHLFEAKIIDCNCFWYSDEPPGPVVSCKRLNVTISH